MSDIPFPKLLAVEPRGTDCLRLTYDDGVTGDVSVAHLISGGGVFAVLKDVVVFRSVGVGDSGQVAWNEDLELCPEALYLDLTKRSLNDVIGDQQNLSASA